MPWTGYLGSSWFGGTLTTISVPTQVHYACAANGLRTRRAEPEVGVGGTSSGPIWPSSSSHVVVLQAGCGRHCLKAGCARRLRFPVGGSGCDAALLQGLGRGDPTTTPCLQILKLLLDTIVGDDLNASPSYSKYQSFSTLKECLKCSHLGSSAH